jgi:hypothetical protein
VKKSFVGTEEGVIIISSEGFNTCIILGEGVLERGTLIFPILGSSMFRTCCIEIIWRETRFVTCRVSEIVGPLL